MDRLAKECSIMEVLAFLIFHSNLFPEKKYTITFFLEIIIYSEK